MSHTIKTNPSASEIDDIFTSNARTVTPKVNPRSALKRKKQKRKKKAIKTQLAEPKRPAPEIVFDTSAQQPDTSKTTSHGRPLPPRKRQKVAETKLVQDNFRDSRGTGPRRKTDEGFKIYKEDELGINAEAGGSPLCPFDCNCCF